jgi:Flp pilus assembly protein TadG
MAPMSCSRQRGQALVELAIVMPGVLLGLMIVLGLSLVSRADGGVAGVAVEAARAAALASDPVSASAAARNEAASVGDGYGLTNGSLRVSTVDASGFRRGGEVRVVVTYVLPVGGLPLVGWPAITLRHEGVAPIDPNRTFR